MLPGQANECRRNECSEDTRPTDVVEKLINSFQGHIVVLPLPYINLLYG